MANLTTKIKLYLGTDVDFTKDVIVNDDGDGKGSYIFYWSDSLGKAKPTDDQLNAFETDGNTEETNNTVRNTRRTSYGSIGDQLDLLYKDMLADKGNKTGEWFKAVKKVKDDNPKS